MTIERSSGVACECDVCRKYGPEVVAISGEIAYIQVCPECAAEVGKVGTAIEAERSEEDGV